MGTLKPFLVTVLIAGEILARGLESLSPPGWIRSTVAFLRASLQTHSAHSLVALSLRSLGLSVR